MKLPDITYKQQEILKLIYTYRFLNRSQIQQFMGHTDKRRISAWLQDLRAKHYLEWIYDGHDFALKTKPAIYYLGINGIRYLKMLNAESGDAEDAYPLDELHKRYRESGRSQSYIDRCQLIADCCLTLKRAATNAFHYYSETEADYMRGGYYEYLTDSDLIHPHLVFSKDIPNDTGEDEETINTYFLEVFDPNYPRYRMQKRLKQYIEYLDDKDWEGETNDNTAPIVLLVCPRMTDLIYAKRRTRGIYGSQYIQDKDTPEDERLHIRFTTAEKIQKFGVLADIWEEA